MGSAQGTGLSEAAVPAVATLFKPIRATTIQPASAEFGESEHGVREWMFGIFFHPGEQLLHLFLCEK